MSNCCTPEYVSISDVGITGDIIVKRGTGNAPSCGYYEYNSGDAELEYLNYHIVDLKYDTGSGFWTFSGNSTGFNDPTIYRSTKSNIS